MKEFNQNISIVMDFLKEKGYKDHTIQCHEAFYKKLSVYLSESGQDYNPNLGLALVSDGENSFLKPEKHWAEKACIAKLNDVYIHGRITKAQVSPRKSYSSLKLNSPFQDFLTGFSLSARSAGQDSTLQGRLFLQTG